MEIIGDNNQWEKSILGMEIMEIIINGTKSKSVIS